MKNQAERQKQIDDRIEEWHDLGAEEYFDRGNPTLFAYLGWTWTEYKAFAEFNVLPPEREGAL